MSLYVFFFGLRFFFFPTFILKKYKYTIYICYVCVFVCLWLYLYLYNVCMFYVCLKLYTYYVEVYIHFMVLHLHLFIWCNRQICGGFCWAVRCLCYRYKWCCCCIFAFEFSVWNVWMYAVLISIFSLPLLLLVCDRCCCCCCLVFSFIISFFVTVAAAASSSVHFVSLCWFSFIQKYHFWCECVHVIMRKVCVEAAKVWTSRIFHKHLRTYLYRLCYK